MDDIVLCVHYSPFHDAKGVGASRYSQNKRSWLNVQLENTSMTAQPSPTPLGHAAASHKARRGRPPASEAGLVEERVLDAATALFLELGFGRTTLDKVSERSGAGKSALYGRYADKAGLFAAVVERSIHQMFAGLAPMTPGGDVADRLRHVGMELANSLLVPRCVALMRITAAEAVNFPDLATMAYRVSFEGSVNRVVAALDPESVSAPSAATVETAKRFVELALHSMSFQAAYGAPIGLLRERCASDVEDAILLLRTKGLLTD